MHTSRWCYLCIHELFFFFVSFFDLHTYVRLVRSTYAVYPNRCEFALTPATVSCHSLAIVLSNVTRSYDGHNSLRKYLQLAISTRLKNSVIPTKMNKGIEKYGSYSVGKGAGPSGHESLVGLFVFLSCLTPHGVNVLAGI